jgi:hypothetical protein
MTVRFYFDRSNKISNGWSHRRFDWLIPIILGKGDNDVEKHWLFCEVIGRSRGTLDANKLVEF